MALNKSLFSSVKQDWKTPEVVYQGLHEEFDFDCDPCPAIEGGLHDKDMLGSDWGQRNFVNPPYDKIAQWVKKAYEEWQKDKTVVLLIPSRTDTRWWHDYIMKASEIRFIKGRLRFGGAKNSAPFPSAIIVFKNGIKGAKE